jgi:hypothetical protein
LEKSKAGLLPRSSQELLSRINAFVEYQWQRTASKPALSAVERCGNHALLSLAKELRGKAASGLLKNPFDVFPAGA